MQKQIFVVNGSGGVGKDTFCNLVALNHARAFIVSSVTPAKYLAQQIGWNGDKGERDRKFLSDFKDLMTEYNDYPMTYLTAKVEEFRHSDYQVMFMFIREPGEIEKAVKAFGAKTVLITAKDRVKPITTNHADDGVYDYAYDFYLDNSGTLQDLEAAVEGFCATYGIYDPCRNCPTDPITGCNTCPQKEKDHA